MARGTQLGAWGVALALGFAIASCTGANRDEQTPVSSAGSSGTAQGGASPEPTPVAYVDAGAAGKLPECTKTSTTDCQVGEALDQADDRYCWFCRPCTAAEESLTPPYDCGDAGHSLMDPGQCGTRCVANDLNACVDQQTQYALALQRISDKYDVPCTQDADCVGFLVTTPCARFCAVAPKTSLAAVSREVAAVDNGCSACPLVAPLEPYEDTSCAFNTCWRNRCISGGAPL